LRRTSKSTLLMTEEFGGEQVPWDRGAIDANKSARAPGATACELPAR
jgi:hypothetical protein